MSGCRCRAVLAMLVLWATPALASDCLIRLADVAAPPRFAGFPAARGRPAAPAVPVLGSAQARLFRTVLREGAAAGPNFAGHFTVVAWGCGASCTTAAIVDARTGRVLFPDVLRSISAVHVADPADPLASGYNSLRFQRDSRLLIVLGAPGEDGARDGVTFLEWRGTALRLLRFVPRGRSCAG